MTTSVSRRKVDPGKSFAKIGLIGKWESKVSLNCLKKLLPALKKVCTSNPHIRIFIDRSLLRQIPKASFLVEASPGSMGSKCDLILSVGGDGTLLRASRILLESEGWKTSSLLGINTGHLGFLTFLGSDEASSKVTEVLLRPEKIRLERRSCLEVKIFRKKKILKTFHVLNDCVLKNGALSRLIEYQVSMNKDFLSSYRADGLIISTPTGSTAYNLAAGGAILEPQIPAIQLTPICAQSFSNKPIVVSDENSISLVIAERASDVHLTLDGHTGVKLAPQDRIQIRKSSKSIALLWPPGTDESHYIHSLRQKLKWGLVSPSPT